ncbi:MAG: ABC transporter ATP-binding protein [Phycisphaerae bacterium]|nr:ABC transporter ATP-binding protein [Phycisphaerales bacterium]
MSLRLEQVGVTLGTGRRARRVLSGVTVEFKPGRVTAIIGPNGAGKSTLLRTAQGLVSRQEGRVELDGVAVEHIRGKDRARRLVYVPQRSGAAFAFTAGDIVRMGLHAAGGARLGTASDAAVLALATVELADRLHDPVGELSAGQQQRVTIARALVQVEAGLREHAAEPSNTRKTVVVLADEPVSAMDPRHAMSTLRLLKALAGAGAAVAVVLHDLSLAASVADDAVALGAGGRIVATGTSEAVFVPEVLGALMGIGFARVAIPGGVLIGPSGSRDEPAAGTILP